MFSAYAQPLFCNLSPIQSHTQAIKRLTPAEQYDRAYRLKRACQASVLHKPLPKEQWTKPEEVCLGFPNFASL